MSHWICICISGQCKFSKNWNLFENIFCIFKMLMFYMQYWNCNNICSAWKIKKKTKHLAYFSFQNVLAGNHNAPNQLLIIYRLISSKLQLLFFILWLCNFPFYSKILWPRPSLSLEKLAPFQNQNFLSLPNRYFFQNI